MQIQKTSKSCTNFEKKSKVGGIILVNFKIKLKLKLQQDKATTMKTV